MLGNYLQQKTAADDILRCIFFLALKFKGLDQSKCSVKLHAITSAVADAVGVGAVYLNPISRPKEFIFMDI